MKGILEVFGISAFVLLAVALFRFLWNKYIAKKENKHAILEPIVANFNADKIGLEFFYRLPVAGEVKISVINEEQKTQVLLNKNHQAGYFKFAGNIENIGLHNKICFKAPGTYIERGIKKPQK